MAFVVEDGSIVANANSFVSVAEANAYHTDRGNSVWTGDDAVKQAALIKATDFIQQKYGCQWKGYKVDPIRQPLDWPRAGIDYVDYQTIPEKLKNAVCELALEALSEELNPSLERGGAVKREKVDVVEVEYMDSASSTTKRPAIDGMLREYLSRSGFNIPVVRS
jgi:hypothetical protein